MVLPPAQHLHSIVCLLHSARFCTESSRALGMSGVVWSAGHSLVAEPVKDGVRSTRTEHRCVKSFRIAAPNGRGWRGEGCNRQPTVSSCQSCEKRPLCIRQYPDLGRSGLSRQTDIMTSDSRKKPQCVSEHSCWGNNRTMPCDSALPHWGSRIQTGLLLDKLLSPSLLTHKSVSSNTSMCSVIDWIPPFDPWVWRRILECHACTRTEFSKMTKHRWGTP